MEREKGAPPDPQRVGAERLPSFCFDLGNAVLPCGNVECCLSALHSVSPYYRPILHAYCLSYKNPCKICS